MITELSGDFVQWLRGFYYTVQTGSVSAAAEKMRRSQPAVSYQLKNLEKQLGVSLFSGTGQGGKRQLTRDGKFLYRKALELFRVIDSISDEIGQAQDRLQGEISIASGYSALQCYLPRHLGKFSRQYPGIHFRIAGGSQLSLYKRVYAREFDIAILCVDNPPPEFEAEVLFESDLALISPKSGKLAVPELPSLEEIAALPFIAHPDQSSLWPLLRSQFGKYGLSLQTRHVVSHFDALKQCVAEQMGLGIVDGFTCGKADEKALNVLPLSRYFAQRKFGYIRRLDAFPTEAEEAFLKYLRKGSLSLKEKA